MTVLQSCIYVNKYHVTGDIFYLGLILVTDVGPVFHQFRYIAYFLLIEIWVVPLGVGCQCQAPISENPQL